MVAAGLWLVAAALLWRTSVPDVHAAHLRPGDVFGAEFLARSARYHRGLRLFWIGATLAQLLALVAAVTLAPRARARGIVGGVALGLATLVAAWLAALPFVLGAHWWRRRYGVSRADYGTILVDPWLERLGSLAAAALAIAGVMLLARRLGDRWWIVGGPAFAAFGTAFLLAQPYLLVPRLKPLRNPQLEAEIKRLARLEGVGEVRVEVRDASRRTRAINAELYGVGPTKRIIIWDTALDGRLTPAEVAQLAAHEFGHVHANHVWKSVGWLFLFAVPGAYVIAVATRGRGGLGRPAAVPVALLTITVLELAVLPVTNVISRRYEAEADWLGMQATHRPAAQEGLIRELAQASLGQPEPPLWAHVLLDTHPTPLQRIATARSAEALRGGS
ncbi:MAG TPA: M48 family metalloprotease [Gaiellaceae bacterium]